MDKTLKSLSITLCLSLLCSCAFTPHKDKRPYPHLSKNQPPDSSPAIDVMVSTELDGTIGMIRNGYGAETAVITVPYKRNKLLQLALKDEFKSAGVKVTEEAQNRLVIRLNQYETELAQEGGGVGYFSVCDVLMYLSDGKKVSERNAVVNEKEFSYWAVTASSGVDSFYALTKKCAQEIVKLVKERGLK